MPASVPLRKPIVDSDNASCIYQLHHRIWDPFGAKEGKEQRGQGLYSRVNVFSLLELALSRPIMVLAPLPAVVTRCLL